MSDEARRAKVAASNKPVSVGFFYRQYEALAETVGKRLHALETRIAQLEAGGAKSLLDAYRGAYQAGKLYRRGELATHGGSLWFCNVETMDRPGNGSHWVLAVKSGRDGKDAPR